VYHSHTEIALFLSSSTGYCAPHIHCIPLCVCFIVMSTASTLQAISDTLHSNIPKLASNSLSWVIFELQFSAAIKAKECWGHFEGKDSKPLPPGALDDGMPAPDPTGEKWEKDEATTKNMLLQKIPDSMHMKIHQHTTVALAWASIVKEYTRWSVFTQTELRAAFLESRCPDKGDVCKFLDDL
jgi:gag-polypeptide of LTR copia-type